VCIARVSYSGDLRMLVGENRQKCFNIVRPQMRRFARLYKPYLIKETLDKYLECDFETGQCGQYLNHATIYHHLNQLPKNLIKTMMTRRLTPRSHFYDTEEYVLKLTNRVDYKEIVADAVKSIVTYTSTVQAAKGVLTAGWLKTVNYSMRKLRKMLKI
jgi:translocator assembly and maintenance protein 41